MRIRMKWFPSLVVVVILLKASVTDAQSLGSAGDFGVLGATTVTNTGPSVVTGHVGVSPGTGITGFPPGVVLEGAIHPGGLVAARAHADAFVANEELKLMECPTANDLTGQDLGGLMLPPGVYCFSSSAQLTGLLTLVGEGSWTFQVGSALTTASASAVVTQNIPETECQGANVFWQMGSSATLGTGTSFIGNIVATASITANTGARVIGSLLAVNGAVTLDTNVVSACGAATVPPPPPPPPVPCDCDCDHHHGDHGDDGEHHGGKDDWDRHDGKDDWDRHDGRDDWDGRRGGDDGRYQKGGERKGKGRER
jgi:hypothetical protein